MADCKRIEQCTFFVERMAAMPSIAEMYRKRLCRGNHAECARYMLYHFLDERNFTVDDSLLGKINELLPTLFPNETIRVERLISGH